MSFIKNMFSTPTPPPVPNAGQIAAAQGAANEDVARTTARLNRADTYTPFGSVTFTDQGDDRYRIDQTLSPAPQSIYPKLVTPICRKSEGSHGGKPELGSPHT